MQRRFLRLVLVSDRTPEPKLDHEETSSVEELAFAARESIGLSVVPLLALAQRRISDTDLDALDALCAEQPEQLSSAQTIRFRMDYWTRVASAVHGGRRAPSMRWWIHRSCEIEERLDACRDSSRPSALLARYRELSHALRRRHGAVEYWLTVLEPLFDATEARLRLAEKQR